MTDFVHLHLHSQYSLLEGAIRLKPLFKQILELKQPAVGLTDTHNLFGAIDFFKHAKEANVKPILGCEVLWTDGVAVNPKTPGQQFKPQFYHLVLLCKNQTGYKNLCRILTESHLEAKGLTRPLVNRELLSKYREGLIVLSGCLRSELAYRILMGEKDSAKEWVGWFQKTFREDFYLELVDNGMPEQAQVNETIYEFGKERGIKSVATADCHYLKPEDAAAQEILQCIEVGKNLDLDGPKSLVPPEFYVKSSELMRERFSRFEGVCDETLAIAEKCDLKFNFKDKEGRKIYHLPNFRPEGVEKEAKFDVPAFFRSQAKEGLERRFKEPALAKIEDKSVYHTRLQSEVEMILKTGFASYFLIVADFINWAKNNGIPVGPGRGSGAGSLVAYSLRITDIDPIQFNLLFERFINPERVSIPDFDVDFCQDRRGEVIQYVTQKYGSDNVSQIITFGKLQARAVVKDVGRVLGLSFAETDQITKLFPNELNIKIADALEKEPKLRDLYDTNLKLKRVIDFALKLEGLSRNAGVHAAGVIITEEPIVNYCPLYVGADNSVVTQFDKDFGEEIGLVKYDFLGLKTLTVIDNAIKLIRKDTPFDLDTLNYEDPAVFDLVSSGDTDGVFQIESSGMKDLCSRLKPNSVEDLTAINALYRPGPLGSGMVDDFIDCKHGRKQIQYEVPILEPILKDTYGVILYQEQVMQIARELSGYSLGQADMLRRAMGKKKPEEMAKHREIFVKGAVERGLPGEKAETIFDLMAKFAEYGFNKSHSAAYAILTYQTAYLKAYFPAEFMAALMTTEMSNTDKLAKYIADARSHKIKVLPPDVATSIKVFSVEKLASGEKAVRFGLEAVKGVGSSAVEAILEARAVEPFSDLMDFFKRVPTRKANKRVMESLIYAGALDGLAADANRPTLIASLEGLMEHGADEQEEKALGQASLFDSFKADDIKLFAPTAQLLKPQEDWPASKKLTHEKEVVGFFVSGHPLDTWQGIFNDWLQWNSEKLRLYCEKLPAPSATPQASEGRYQRPVRKEIPIGGLFVECKEITTKKGARMAFAMLEDLYGKIEVIVFPEAFQSFGEKLKLAITETEPVVITGELEYKDETVKLFLKTLEFSKVAYEGRAKSVLVTLPASGVTVEQLREFKKSLFDFRGKCPLRIRFTDPNFQAELSLPANLKVEGTPQMAAAVNKIFGTQVVQLV